VSNSETKKKILWPQICEIPNFMYILICVNPSKEGPSSEVFKYFHNMLNSYGEDFLALRPASQVAGE
jgi:hypothetical protein